MFMMELISQLRNELSNDQLSRYAYMLSNWVLGAPLTTQSQILCTKTLFSIVDPIIQKLQKEQAVVLCATISETCVEKIRSLDLIFQVVTVRAEKRGEETDANTRLDVTYIEKDRPFSSAYYVTENPESLLLGTAFPHSLEKMR